MEALLASTPISVVISIAVAYIAFKVAFFTLKRVVLNVVTGALTYWVCVNVLNIPMDMGIDCNFRTYSNDFCCWMGWLFTLGGPHVYQS